MNNFSVLMSIYHKENPAYFREALDSVFSQTIQPNELILIQDGALTPELYAVIEEYEAKYPVFKIIKNETNIGLGLSLAKGVEASANEYIFRMDTDDRMPKYRFEKQIVKLDEGYDVVGSWSLVFKDSIDNIIAIRTRPEKHEDIEKVAHRRSPINHPGCAFRRSSVLNAGNYQHNLLYEDYDLWVRMFLSGYRFTNMQEVLLFFRSSDEQIARRGGWNYVRNEIRSFCKFFKLGFYTPIDLIRNTVSRFIVRLLPSFFRSILLKYIWKKNIGTGVKPGINI